MSDVTIPEKMIIFTQELFNQGLSRYGSFSGKQLRVFGINFMSYKGWKKTLIGSMQSEEKIAQYLALKDAHINSPKKIKQIRAKLTKKGRRVKKKAPVQDNLAPVVGTQSYVIVNADISWEDQYLHPNWQRKRLHIFQRDNFCCRVCGENQKQIHVHHLKYFRGKFIWEAPDRFLITLCDKCHSSFHGKKSKEDK